MSAVSLFSLSPEVVKKTRKSAETFADIFADTSLFREIADMAMQGMVLHWQHQPLYVNRAWAALHGMTVDEATSLPSILPLIHRSDRERLKAYAYKRLASDHDAPDRYRYRALHKDGRFVWLENFVRVVDWRGHRLIQTTTINVDDEEREVDALRLQRQSMKEEVRERSEALRLSNRALHIRQAFIDQMSERVFVVGRDYRTRMSNRANLEFRKLTREQFIGRHLRDIVGSVYFEDTGKPRLDRAFEGQTERYEETTLGPTGQRRYLQVTLEPFREDNRTIDGAIVSIRDITDLKESEEQRRLFASVIEQISDRIAVIDLNYRFQLVNKAILEHHQLEPGQILNRPLADLFGKKSFEEFVKHSLDRCFQGEKFKLRRSQIDKSIGRQEVDIFFEPYRGVNGEIVGAVVMLRDVTEAQEMSDRLAYQARFDQLTGLLNRRAFEQILTRAMVETAASGRSDVLCFIDLDQFKIVNDTVGHLAGDQLLKEVAKLLSSKLHDGDVLARFGGDEFVLLLHRCSLRRAKRAAEHLIATLADFKFFHEGSMFKVGASIGMTAITRHVDNTSDVLARADLACYAAKDNGRNQVQIFKKCDVTIRKRREEMYRAGGIRSALDDDRFVLFGQPITPLVGEGHEPAHVEILLRMIGERQQVIKPNAFIPAAERYGLMAELDRWVIRKTVDELTRAKTSLAETNVSINLSGVTLNDETSLDFIRQTLSDSQLPPERISFEITETVAIRRIEATQAFMDDLRSWGCRFALDDFGSGLSSLKYLKRLPVDFLKIDGSFIRDVSNDAGSRAMVKAINQMARDLGIKRKALKTRRPLRH